MKKIIVVLMISCCLEIVYGQKAQKVPPADSAYIFKNILSYEIKENPFDEPFIEEYWKTENTKAKKYFYLAAFIKNINPYDRIILLSYLDEDKKMEGLEWVYNHLETKMDTVNFYIAINYVSDLSYSKLGISKESVKKYFPEVEYK